jgi:hypothetical protein
MSHGKQGATVSSAEETVRKQAVGTGSALTGVKELL